MEEPENYNAEISDFKEIEKSTIYQPSLKEMMGWSKEKLIIRMTEQKNEITKQYKGYKPLIDEIEKRENKKNILEVIWMLMKASPHLIKLVYYVIKLYSLIKKEKI
jgi:hypothetical protein